MISLPFGYHEYCPSRAELFLFVKWSCRLFLGPERLARAAPLRISSLTMRRLHFILLAATQPSFSSCDAAISPEFILPLAQLNRTKMTVSPLKNILLMKRSLLIGLPFLPCAFVGVSVHISLTFSSTMLQCLSNAFTRARSLRLFRHEMRTWLWFLTAV